MENCEQIVEEVNLETAEAQKLSMKRIAYRRVLCEKWIERNRMDILKGILKVIDEKYPQPRITKKNKEVENALCRIGQ